MTIIYCDRCKGPVERPFQIRSVRPRDDYPLADLCNECFYELEVFLDIKPKEVPKPVEDLDFIEEAV